MNRLLGVVALALMVSSIGHSVAAQSATATPPPRDPARGRADGLGSGTATISGRVVAADSGAAVRHAEIRAVDDGDVRVTMADEQGRFQLSNLPAGQWTVTASKSGFITWRFGQTRPFNLPPPVTLEPGQRVAATIALPRGGAITGRVYDELGEPVTAARVNVYRSRMLQGQRRLESVGRSDWSDDTGAYRVHGLPPGRYYVAASLRVAPEDSPVDTTYAPTYFPGTGNLAEAQRVSLGFGGEAGASFPLLPVRTVRISGSVFDSTGAPADAFLNLVSEAGEHGVPLGTGGATRPDGTFTLPDIAPGTYVLHATLRGAGSEAAALPMVIGNDVTGVTLATRRGGSLRGTFVAEDGVRSALPSGLTVLGRGVRAGAPFVRGTGDGRRFELDGLGGPFRLDVGGLPPEWAIKTVFAGGREVTDLPIDLRGAREVAAVVVLTDRLIEVAGSVTSPMVGSRVVVFPDDPAKWAYPARYIRTVDADEEGRFRVVGLPPAERYLALAVDYLEDGEGDDPEFLAALKGLATVVSLADGERGRVNPVLVRR